MGEIQTFAVIGGDCRQAWLAESIASDGYFVYAAEFEKYPFTRLVKKVPIEEAVEKSDHIILPMPVTRDGVTLNAPYGYDPIILDEYFAQMLWNKPVFGGQLERLPKTESWYQVKMKDYCLREEFAVGNAIPAAEGAIEIAMTELPIAIHGSRCLVTGFGHLGKKLALLLHGLGAFVTVAARSEKDLAWVASLGMRGVKIDLIKESGSYEVIFNTVPALVLDTQTLAMAAEDALVVELASPPYGVDFAAAKRLNIPVILAESLPGKVAPKSAGAIIKNVVYHMLQEI